VYKDTPNRANHKEKRFFYSAFPLTALFAYGCAGAQAYPNQLWHLAPPTVAVGGTKCHGWFGQLPRLVKAFIYSHLHNHFR